ncbi:metallopeptidase family protein [soil metagenome]
MNETQRQRFDAILERVLEALPAAVRAVIEEVPVIVEDRPAPELLESLRKQGVLPDDEPEADDELMGLHSGVAITEQSLGASGELPPMIHVFRDAVVAEVGGWKIENAESELAEEIRVTLLHEIGHHFGLDEDDLDELGYG